VRDFEVIATPLNYDCGQVDFFHVVIFISVKNNCQLILAIDIEFDIETIVLRHLSHTSIIQPSPPTW